MSFDLFLINDEKKTHFTEDKPTEFYFQEKKQNSKLYALNKHIKSIYKLFYFYFIFQIVKERSHTPLSS